MIGNGPCRCESAPRSNAFDHRYFNSLLRHSVPKREADGMCAECRAGYQNLCDHMIIPGVQRMGGWAQYVTLTAADLNCIPLPEGGDKEAGAKEVRRLPARHGAGGRAHARPSSRRAYLGCGDRRGDQRTRLYSAGSRRCWRPNVWNAIRMRVCNASATARVCAVRFGDMNPIASATSANGPLSQTATFEALPLPEGKRTL